MQNPTGFRPLLREAAPGFSEALAPVLNCGAQGVDLFFILSGFVTDLKLPRPDGTVVLGARHLALPRSRPVPSRRQLTAVSYVRQIVLVQERSLMWSIRSPTAGSSAGPSFIGADGVHPTDAGHGYMADKIVPLIRAQLSERY